jgi:hypothetical protein
MFSQADGPNHDSISQNGKCWQPLNIHSTLQHYSRVLHALLQAVLLTIQGTAAQYQFPLSQSDIQAGQNLLLFLDNPDSGADGVQLLHAFAYPFLGAHDRTGGYNKWMDVLECFMAIYSLKSDGNYEDASSSTHFFAILKYLCRGTILFEAFRIAEKDGCEPQQ